MFGLSGYNSESDGDSDESTIQSSMTTSTSSSTTTATTSEEDIKVSFGVSTSLSMGKSKKSKPSVFTIDAAPNVDNIPASILNSLSTQTSLVYNPQVDEMWSNIPAPKAQLGHSGIAERTHISDLMFKKAYQRPAALNLDRTISKRMKTNRDSSDLEGYQGPWAKFEGEEEVVAATEEQLANAASHQQRKQRKDQEVEVHETSVFFGESRQDYRGRSFLAAPLGFKPYSPETSPCFIPKSNYHTYTGHNKGVNCIRFFPQTGKYILSASFDHTIRLWDTESKRPCVQLYSGHSAGVRAVEFSPDGTQFMSISYDKYVKIWDTETGKVLHRVTDNTEPTCGAFNPLNTNEIIVGGRRKATQWDLRANEIVQEYKDPSADVNTITFIGENDKFVLTSDDKRILAYDYGVPVVIKAIQDTELHAIASVAVSPNGKYMVGNAQNNQALVLAIQDRVKLNRKKVFTGHTCSGYACGLTFSPDGQFLASGDAQGQIVYWDFKSGKLLTKAKAHSAVTIDVQWHPADPNIVASCSWDNTIKLWR